MHCLNENFARQEKPLTEFHNYAMHVESHDFDNAFTFIQHSDVTHAWAMLCQLCNDLNLTRCWINPGKTIAHGARNARRKFASWSVKRNVTRGSDTWIEVRLRDIAPCLAFLLDASCFTFAGTKGKQANGLAMGSAHASSLCTMVLTMYEYAALTSQAWKHCTRSLRDKGIFLDAFRYVDDLRLFILAPDCTDKAELAHISQEIRKFIWHDVSPLKVDTVNNTVGLFVWVDRSNRRIRWLPSTKDLPTILQHWKERTPLTERGLPTLQHSSSHCSPSQLQGALTSLFEKCRQQASDNRMCTQALILWCACLHLHSDYTWQQIESALSHWCGKKHVWLQHKSSAPSLVERAKALHERGVWPFDFTLDEVKESFSKHSLTYKLH